MIVQVLFLEGMSFGDKNCSILGLTLFERIFYILIREYSMFSAVLNGRNMKEPIILLT